MHLNANDMKVSRILKFTGFGILFAALAALLLGVLTYLTQYLWNWLVPALFAGPAISFWQTLGLLVLAKILLWPLGGRRGNWRNHKGYNGRHWAARWESMSPEDRERFKEKMKEKWCRPRASVESGSHQAAKPQDEG